MRKGNSVLRVLKEVGLVGVHESGQQRLYRLNGEGLKPIHDWTMSFERYWEESGAGAPREVVGAAIPDDYGGE